MNEHEVRALFYERLARSGNADVAVSETYLSVGLHVISLLAPAHAALPGYWGAVTTAIGMKTAMCRAEMNPGASGIDPVPIAGRMADAFLSVLGMQRELLEYLHDRLEGLPPTPMKAKHDRTSLRRELAGVAREQERYFGAGINGGYALVPRRRFLEFDRFSDGMLQALLGVQAYQRFADTFNAALSVLRAEHARQGNPADGSAN